MWYEDLSKYSSVELEPGVSQSMVLCHNDLCCHLNYSIMCPGTESSCDKYRLVSFSGLRTVGGGNYGIYIQVCLFFMTDHIFKTDQIY